MSDGFDAMVARSRTFLAELAAQNNDRAWFDAHKPVFKTEIEGAAKLLLRVDELDRDESDGEGDEGREVGLRFLAAQGDALEPLELAHGLLDAGAATVEGAREVLGGLAAMALCGITETAPQARAAARLARLS